MRFLAFSQNKSFHKFAIDYFSNKEIIDFSSSLDSFLNKFYLYDYDLVLLDSVSEEKCLEDLIKEVREEKGNIPIMCLLESNRHKSLKDLLSLQVNYILFCENRRDIISLKESIGLLIFDKKNDCFSIGSNLLNLCRREHMLLRFLFLNKDEFSSKDKLSQKIIENSYSINSNIVDVYIYRLRKILESNCSGVRIINRKNFGYKITSCTGI